MESKKTAIILGASGLIGGLLLQKLLKNDEYAKVKIIVRKPLPIAHHKLEQCIIDFKNKVAYENAITLASVLFCCIGTTTKSVNGNKELYRSVDFDIPVFGAINAIKIGIKKYIIVSSIGANEKSSNFYLKLKGQVENTLAKLPFESLIIMQPSLLIGKRNDARFGEKIAQTIAPFFNPILMGCLAKYKCINAEVVANAMYNESLKNKKGIFTLSYNEIVNA
jgi:uncharacterized protein YbjT (DUF2867 family)